MSRRRGILAVALSIVVGIASSVAVQSHGESRARWESLSTFEMARAALVYPGLTAFALPLGIVADVKDPHPRRSRVSGDHSLAPGVAGVIGWITTFAAPALLTFALWRAKRRLLVAGCISVVLSLVFSAIWVLEVVAPTFAN